MGANFTDPRSQYVASSGTLTMAFSIPECSYNSFQVTKTSTGSFSAIRLETSNYAPGGAVKGPTDNYLWAIDDDFSTVYSGSIMTASNSPASRLYHLGNLNSRFARVIIDVGQADIWTISWHGKSGT